MLKFIVLGYVPGTTYQISFGLYLALFTVLGLLMLAGWYALDYLSQREAVRIASIRLVAR